MSKLSGFDKSLDISIHALREEGDRPPGGALPQRWISIHALREEGDRSSSTCFLGSP